MPSGGVHITILERTSLRGDFHEIIGRLDGAADSEDAKLMKFAKLGAIGPDLFYAMADYNPDLIELVSFLSKLGGSYECVTKLMARIDQKISKVESDLTLGAIDSFKDAIAEFERTFGFVGAIVQNELMAEVIRRKGNLFPVFEARRQLNLPRERWFWADYLHYIRTGVFLRELLVHSQGKPFFRAYAYGYATHYVTDVVGHPFVNHITGSLWRMYWQRHHLIENFMDAYVWDRWHDAHPSEVDPATEEQQLDSIRDNPNKERGSGASFSFARLHDHIGIGVVPLDDPIDKFISTICKSIEEGFDYVGVPLAPPSMDSNVDVQDWAETLAVVFKAAYPSTAKPPENLSGNGRFDGYPTALDIASAYTTLRLFLKVATEESITEPEFPDVVKDVWDKILRLSDDVIRNLGGVPPIPTPAVDLQRFSLEDVWKAIKDYVGWAIDSAIAVAAAAFQLIRDTIAVGGALLVDTVKACLYLVNKSLFDIYKQVRFLLVREGYTMPFTEELDQEVGGGVSAQRLWRTPIETNLQEFPKEELPDTEQKTTGSSYIPWLPPELLVEMGSPPHCEEPRTWVSPYGNDEPPDTFIDAPLGQRELLSPKGPIGFDFIIKPGESFQPPTNFGGAIANCVKIFETIQNAEAMGSFPESLFPDYNLDGDRGYGWACWDVRNGSGDNLGPPHDGSYVTVDPVLVR